MRCFCISATKLGRKSAYFGKVKSLGGLGSLLGNKDSFYTIVWLYAQI